MNYSSVIVNTEYIDGHYLNILLQKFQSQIPWILAILLTSVIVNTEEEGNICRLASPAYTLLPAAMMCSELDAK